MQRLKNNTMSSRIIAMLGEHSDYGNIGIKTALGMGVHQAACKSLLKLRRLQSEC